MTDRGDVETAVADAHRRGWALVLAATARVARDLDVAEECVQEAYAAALVAWARDGVPDNPEAWLTTAAKRRAMDALRRERAFLAKLPLLVEPEETVAEVALDEPVAEEPDDVVPDERLRLIFLCCHPALAQEAQLALTLRLVCGVPTGDIARAFLVSEATMAARLTRAKKKIAPTPRSPTARRWNWPATTPSGTSWPAASPTCRAAHRFGVRRERPHCERRRRCGCPAGMGRGGTLTAGSGSPRFAKSWVWSTSSTSTPTSCRRG